MGVGKWLRSQTEYCIMAVKGKPLINLTNQTTVLNAKNTGHSTKPMEFYNMVDNLCIGRKLDYFARDKKEGWDNYGVQAIKEVKNDN
jgi:N6-adenosine-specific RNA methylase IME4